MTVLGRMTGLAALASAVSLGGAASAQSLSPMGQDIITFADTAVVRLNAGNPSERRMRLTLTAYDEDWAPIDGVTASRRSFTVPPARTVSVLVTVPMEDRDHRTVRICVVSDPLPGPGGQLVRGEVCGKYAARRRAI